MGLPVPSALERRDRLWPAVVVSLLLHGGLVAWGVVRRPSAPIDLDQKPIVAKLVRLGEKRPEEWLPRKEAAPPPPAPAAAPSAPAAPVPAKPSAPSLEAKAPPRPAAPSPSPSSSRGTGNALASVLSRVQKQVEDQRWGSPDGDPEGDSDTGSEGDQYLARVHRELTANYNVPRTLSTGEVAQLRAVVVLFLDASGRIVDHRFEQRSGNGAYDAALERAIQSSRLPPPPPELQPRLRGGLVVNFHL